MTDEVITQLRTRPAKDGEGCVQCLLYEAEDCSKVEEAFGLPDCMSSGKLMIHVKEEQV